VRYSFKSLRKQGFCAVVLLFLVGLSGCDKIPFLSKFFPSLEKSEPTSAKPPEAPKPQAAQQPPAANVLAKVNNWTLTLEEFKDKLNSLKEALPEYDINDFDSKKLVLEELMRQQLLIQDAEKSGLAQKKDITEAVEEFRKTLLVREIAAKITAGIEVADQEAQDYYDQNKNSFAAPGEWHIREIVVPTQEEATEILIELLKGADFAATAQARSKSESASKGGDLGFVKELPFSQMEVALSTLDAGGISSAFKGPDGFYIVKLEDKKEGEVQSFDALKEEIKAGLTLMKQQQKILAYIDELKQKSTVQVNEELLKQ